MNESYLNSDKNTALSSKPSIAKRLLLMVLFVSSFTTIASAQTASSTWSLTSNGNSSNVGNVTGSAVAIGSELNNISYDGTVGISTVNWSDNAGSLKNIEYYEFKVTPSSNTIFNVTAINFEHSVTKGNWKVQAYYSTDNFATSTPISTDFSSKSSTPTAIDNTVSINVDNATLSVRIYGWKSGKSDRSLRIKNVVISGSTCAKPVVPGTASAYSATCTGFTAQWGYSNYTTAYFIDVATNSSFSPATVVPAYDNLNVGNVLNLALTGLNPGTTYYYRVRSSNSCGTSSNSSTMTYATSPFPTVAPVAKAATNIQCSYAQLNFSTGSNVTGVYLDIARDSGFTDFISGYNDYNVTYNNGSIPVSNLPAGTLYYRIRGYNSCGVTTNSNTISFSTTAPIGGDVSPAQKICSGSSPANLILTGYSTTNTEILRWQKSTDVAFSSPIDITGTTATLSGATIGNLTTDTYFRAVVRNKFGSWCETFSNPVLVSIASVPIVTLNKVDVTCASSNSGTISPVISGGLSNVRYIKLTQKHASYQQVAEIQAFEIFAGTNVALSSGGAAATSSSDYSSDYLATEVNDGVTATNGNMWHSYSPNINEWIKIDLQSGKNIDYIKIYNRTDCCQDRGQNMLLELFDASNNLVYSKTIDLYQSGANIPVNVNVLDVSWADGATTLNRTGLSSGTYTLNYADAVGCPISSPTVINSVNATSAPTVGTKTQPTCSTATGSVVLNGLPSGSWILTQNPGGTTTTGTGTSTTISGLSSGTYTYSVVGANNGLKAEYFNSKDLSGPAVLTRTDATVSFDWGNGSPDSSINNEAFSARWSGLVQPLYSETYTFKTTSDDGVRLWVNGVKIIDNWTDHAVFDNTGTIALTAGEKYNIVLEYYENGGLAVSKLSWSSPTNPTSVIIPTTQLFSVSTCSSPASANVVIDAQPAMPVTPTVGAPTQPTCSVPTGSFAISNYNSSYTYSVSPSTGVTISGSTVTAPVGSYTVTASSGGCTSSASPSVAINSAVAKTWNGITWSPSPLVPPTKNDVVIINGDYNTSSNGDLNACSLTINAGYKLTITPLQFVVVQNDLTVNGTLDVLDKGSLVMVNDAGIVKNNGTTNIHRFTTEYKKLDYVYWSTPVTSTTIASTFSNWRIDRAFEYNNGWKFATSLIPAMGCAITVPNPIVTSPPTPNISEVVFKGQVNNGVIKVKNIAPSALYLIGNPYPSAIDADAFLNENAGAIEGTIYFWTHNTAIQLASNIKNGTAGSGAYAFTSDDYAVYNIVGGVATGLLPVSNSTIPTTLKPKGEIASCQGFFASSNAADKLTSTEIVFKNAMRLGSGTTASLDNTNFFRTKASKTAKTFEKNRLWLNLTNTGGAFKQLLVGYVTDATNDYESRFDGESFAGNQYIDFYSVVKDKNLTIQGRALPFDEKDEVPLGYNTTIEGAFTISIDDVDGFMANQSVFLEDKLTNTVFDLKAGNYTFNTAKGTFNDRFVLKYANKTLGMEYVVEKEDGILALYANNYQTLIIHNKGISSTVNSVALFNMTGQRIGVWNVKDFEQTNIQIPIKDISSGIYIVKISTTNGDSSKKIVVN